MARLREKFNFETGALAAVRDAAREATGAYQDAARALDTLKERVLIVMGMPQTAEVIHRLAHTMPVQFDKIGDLLHQRHIEQIYPATEEYRQRPENLDDVFEEVIGLLERIEKALRRCVEESDRNGLYPLGRGFENLQMENSEQYEKFLYAWQMYSEHEMSATSFEGWIGEVFEKDGE